MKYVYYIVETLGIGVLTCGAGVFLYLFLVTIGTQLANVQTEYYIFAAKGLATCFVVGLWARISYQKWDKSRPKPPPIPTCRHGRTPGNCPLCEGEN
jgi:hypothetical protein